MEDCLDEQALLDFLAGRLDGAATTRAREHVARCEVCNAIATEVIRGAALLVPASAARARGYELTPGAVLAERYRLVRARGEGGMGVVWEGERLDRPRGDPSARVAIKLLKAFDAAAKKRFLREIAITSTLTHPGLVRVVDVLEDVEAGCPALVMELLEGASLADELARDGRFDRRGALRIATEIARALAEVHAAGLVHRDIKPANIHLQDDAARPVVLLDLGLAKATSGAETTRLTRTGQAVGTPAYMAPEQLAGEASIDARADLWSLGVVLYESITGARPFAGHTVAKVLQAAAAGLGDRDVDGVDAGTSALLRRLLHPDREARPASATVVADALAQLLRDG